MWSPQTQMKFLPLHSHLEYSTGSHIYFLWMCEICLTSYASYAEMQRDVFMCRCCWNTVSVSRPMTFCIAGFHFVWSASFTVETPTSGGWTQIPQYYASPELVIYPKDVPKSRKEKASSATNRVTSEQPYSRLAWRWQVTCRTQGVDYCPWHRQKIQR